MGIPCPVHSSIQTCRHSKSSTMAPKMKLTYFGVRARGEISRLVLAHSKTDYEFEARTFENWAELKPKIPGGSLPVLEIDGKMFGQGIAIQTYLADIGGLMGDSAMDRFKINEISLVREDMLVPETQHFLCGDEKEKAEKEKNLKEAHYPKYCKILEDLIAGDFAVGKKLSLADIVIFEGTTTLSQNQPDILKKYPKINKIRATVAATPGIKEYLAKRPVTPM